MHELTPLPICVGVHLELTPL